MHIYAIGDLHLSFDSDKPMDVFGEAWRDHAGRIESAWRETVGSEDAVLVPGDISWAMQLSGASPDLAFVGRLPGRKILLRGNHDYWWSAVGKVRSALTGDTLALQNDSFTLGDYAVCGTRGWICPGANGFGPEDEKIYQRECMRLEMSLGKAEPGKTILAMLHYPPFSEKQPDSGFTELLEAYHVETAVYGHLHGAAAHRTAFEGEKNGVTYACVAADYLAFRPRRIV